jgi:hypothetical protein
MRLILLLAVLRACLATAGTAFGDSWGADRYQASVHVSPHPADVHGALARKRLPAVKREASAVAAPKPFHDNHHRSTRP